MGNGNGSGDISDVNFFSTQRNDVRNNQPSANLGQEVYRDWQPPSAPGRVAPGDHSGYVTIRDGQNIIYAQPGSTVIINEGQGDRRVGGAGANGYIPRYDDTMAQVNQSRQYQVNLANGYRQPYYGQGNLYQNINGAPEYIAPPPVMAANTGLNFFGLHIGGGRRGGFGINFGIGNPAYGAYSGYPPYQTAFIPQPIVQPAAGIYFGGGRPGWGGYHRGRGGGVGIMIGANMQPNYNYYSNPSYASAYAGGQQYDAYGNPIGYA